MDIECNQLTLAFSFHLWPPERARNTGVTLSLGLSLSKLAVKKKILIPWILAVLDLLHRYVHNIKRTFLVVCS